MIDAGGRQLVSLPYSMEINDRPAFDPITEALTSSSS